GGIPSVAEEIMIARDIMLADYTGGRFHVAHISTKGSVELVRQARKRGIKVSAEATPHHFSLTDDAVREFNTNTKMHPPLRTEDDRKAIIEGLRDGTIEVIATDHAPHASEEKEAEFIHAPFGIIGFETAFGLAMTNLVHTGVIDIFELIRKFVDNPYKILGLETPSIQKGVKANLTIFEPDAQWSVDAARSLSKCTNSPFFGYKFKGKPFATINNNQIFYSIL
ncbi:MAG: amidohydrolase family protein, partial [Calditrichia bacterium]